MPKAEVLGNPTFTPSCKETFRAIYPPNALLMDTVTWLRDQEEGPTSLRRREFEQAHVDNTLETFAGIVTEEEMFIILIDLSNENEPDRKPLQMPASFNGFSLDENAKWRIDLEIDTGNANDKNRYFEASFLLDRIARIEPSSGNAR